MLEPLCSSKFEVLKASDSFSGAQMFWAVFSCLPGMGSATF